MIPYQEQLDRLADLRTDINLTQIPWEVKVTLNEKIDGFCDRVAEEQLAEQEQEAKLTPEID